MQDNKKQGTPRGVPCLHIPLKFFGFEGGITFIIIAVVNAFHIDFAAVDFIGECRFENMLDFNIANWAAAFCRYFQALRQDTSKEQNGSCLLKC